MLKKMLLIITLIIAGIIAIFYLALRTKTKDVSDKAPFTHLINKEIVLPEEMWLVKNLKQFAYENDYLLVEPGTQLFEGIDEKHILPKGTQLSFYKAKLFKNAVSGVTHSILMGKVSAEANEYLFEYPWGNESFSLDANDKPYWTFPKAPWQREEDTTKYFLLTL